MSEIPFINIEDVKRLHLEPGDALVLKVAQGTTVGTCERLKAALFKAFPDHTTVVMTHDLDLAVVERAA